MCPQLIQEYDETSKRRLSGDTSIASHNSADQPAGRTRFVEYECEIAKDKQRQFGFRVRPSVHHKNKSKQKP